jgi:predicted nucleic acid-binding protein
MGAPAEADKPAVRRIVCDTGPLLHLDEAKCLGILQHAGDLHIPPTVDTELCRQDPGWPAKKKSWIHVTPLGPPHCTAAEAWHKAGLLHSGEAEAMELARQLRADWFLTDDSSARLVGQACGLEVHGSLGIVLWAAASEHLTRAEAEAALRGLAESSLWVSPSVLAQAKAALRQLFGQIEP